jgi:hypothetical protein
MGPHGYVANVSSIGRYEYYRAILSKIMLSLEIILSLDVNLDT